MTIHKLFSQEARCRNHKNMHTRVLEMRFSTTLLCWSSCALKELALSCKNESRTINFPKDSFVNLTTLPHSACNIWTTLCLQSHLNSQQQITATSTFVILEVTVFSKHEGIKLFVLMVIKNVLDKRALSWGTTL
jgi:hypothetical protein